MIKYRSLIFFLISIVPLSFLCDYNKTVKFLFDYKKTQLLLKVGLQTATLQEQETASAIVMDEYRKCIQTIERNEVKIAKLIEVIVQGEFDVTKAISQAIVLNRQLGGYLDDKLTFLKPIALIEKYKSTYIALSQKRDKIKSYETDPIPLLSVAFKRIAKQKLCMHELLIEFKDSFYSINTDKQTATTLAQCAHYIVLIKLLQDTSKAFAQLKNKNLNEIIELGGEILNSIVNQSLPEATSRKFLCQEQDWDTIESLATRTHQIIEQIIDQVEDGAVSLQTEWAGQLFFFSKGLKKLTVNAKEFINRDKLLKDLLSVFIRDDLLCFYKFKPDRLMHKDHFLQRLTPVFRVFFNLVRAIGLEQAIACSICDSMGQVYDVGNMVSTAQAIRQETTLFLRQRTPTHLEGIHAAVGSMGSSSTAIAESHSMGTSIESLPSIEKSGPKTQIHASRRRCVFQGSRPGSSRNMPLNCQNPNVQREVIQTLNEVYKFYLDLEKNTDAAIMDYFTTTHDVDALRYKIRLLAHNYANKLRLFMGRYQSMRASGCFASEFLTLDKLWYNIEYASGRTSEFLTYIFKTKMLSQFDFYMRQDDLTDAYANYKKYYGEVCIPKLLALQHTLFSAVITFRTIVNPEIVFSESTAKQKESFVKMAAEFYSGIYGQS